MKPIVFSFFLILIGWGTADAQLRLNGYAGYLFDDSFDNRYSNTSYMRGTIEGGLQWGAGLQYTLNPAYGVELLYFRQDTDVPVSYYRNGPVDDIIDVGINYIMIGGVRYLQAHPVFEPYGGLMAGAVVYSNKTPRENEKSSETKFAWGVRLGSNIWLSDQIGLKIQTHLFSAVEAIGGNFYFGTGGVGAGVNTYSTIFQFGLGGGLAIKLGGE